MQIIMKSYFKFRNMLGIFLPNKQSLYESIRSYYYIFIKLYIEFKKIKKKSNKNILITFLFLIKRYVVLNLFCYYKRGFYFEI